jgi:hypothetical protein
MRLGVHTTAIVSVAVDSRPGVVAPDRTPCVALNEMTAEDRAPAEAIDLRARAHGGRGQNPVVALSTRQERGTEKMKVEHLFQLVVAE